MKRSVRNGESAAVSEDGAATAVLDRRELLRALQQVRDGDFSVQLPGDWTGIDGKIADTFNEIVAANQTDRRASSSASARSSASEGQTRERAQASTTPRARGARWRPRSTR